MPELFQTIPAEEGALLQNPRASLRRVIVAVAALSFALVAALGVVCRVGAVMAELVLPEAQRRVKVLDKADCGSIESLTR